MDFQKFWIIFKWEYLTKVRKKSFIVITLLIPIGFAIACAIPFVLHTMNPPKTHKVAIKDATGLVASNMISLNSTRYINAASTPVSVLQEKLKKGKIDGYIVMSKNQVQSGHTFSMVSNGSGGLAFVSSVRNDLQSAVRQTRLAQANASNQIISIINSNPRLVINKLTATGGQTSSHNTFLFILGYAMAIIIYLAIIFYGGYMMRSVIGEKTNRISEIVVSSAKPSELLMGKIAGIGALGVTQFAIWIGAAVIAVFFAGSAFTGYIGPQTAALLQHLPSIVGIKMIIYFIVFFILGFLLYGTLMAAMGAAVDSQSDTQQMMILILIPIFISFILLQQIAFNPDSPLAVICSLIPFFSPILMISRLPITTVPGWQIGLSIFLLLLSIGLCLYLGSKIYRVGILSYGKSANFKELLKWVRR